ncbi:hypothetical protein EG339_21075 [Chryseobacterium bernardetii]|uniref:Uncharacterized protein n=1 Tax=Chryseobacterium bernardetii TaxID=1241978 RepID=A0A3G6TGI2_9FLAO|nr:MULTISPECIES: hypothetical protein [Chryseobacterium]AZB26899.1 hypothetical protein EG339_21075 [Chryseobacterium bernardetii]MCS3531191.1 hypothetical protein [Chryseobacterium sp. JUb7]
MTNNPYLTFKNDEFAKSEILAKELNISESDFIKIQNWFYLLLLKHEQAIHDMEEQVKTEKELEAKFNQLISSEIERKCYKYILPKLLHYNNVFNDAFLRSLYVVRLGALLRDNLIGKFVKDKMIVYSPEDFFHITVYLRDNYFVSPNSNFIEDILKIEHVRGIFKQATNEVKFSTLKNILHIIQQKTFHHDIICFKKILKLVSPKDVALIDYLKKFQVENQQGCYKILNGIFNLEIAEDDWDDFDIKVQLINFFDTGRGANPSAGWKKKFQELSGTIDSKKLLLTANTVLKNDNCKNFEFDYGAQWGDDTAKRFLKSAQWIRAIL